MEKNYNDEAANWWAERIEAKNNNIPLHGLDLFKEELASQIKSCINIHAGMTISTYASRSDLLDKIAYHAGLNAEIPSGYEMRILFDNVWVYNSVGKLVSSF